jgi:7-carboxy-7-deazaguanine synthase
MVYAIKEILYTLQGEGRQSGRAAVFCRFAGCNLWTGREADRKDAVCRFCDTDFVGTDGPGGGKFATADAVACAVAAAWPAVDSPVRRFVVCTGGEPALQLDDAVIAALHAQGFEIAVESNGTVRMPAAVDWTCISPKAGTTLVQTTGDELKLVFPQPGAEPERFASLEFRHFLLQPMDGPDLNANRQAALAYCLANPKWSLSLQTHKLLGIP